jgi:hypothetical protein
MGEYACAWFGRPPTTAQVVGSIERAKKMLLFWRAAKILGIDIVIGIMFI